MPLVETENLCFADHPLNIEHDSDLPDGVKEEVEAVDYEQPILECLLALVNDCELRQDERDDVVDQGPQVQLVLHSRHDFILDFFDADGVVLEAESFVLVVNH